MSDYISREAAIAALCCDCQATRDCRPGERCADYMRLKSIPAADVRENKRGKWKLIGADKRGRGGIFLCSVCDKTYPYKTLYCPNCGADMREEQT